MELDLSKHASIFTPAAALGTKTIAVVGLGAVGSALALNLAKLGCTNVTLFDFDKVEAHNLANQVLYGPADVGEFKVECAQDTIGRLTGTIFNIALAKITDADEPNGCMYEHRTRVGADIVFSCVDTMAVRMYLFRSARARTACYYGDGRMNARDIAAYGFNPMDTRQAAAYDATLYPDSEVDDSRGGCGITLSVGATAMMVACQMTWQFINHFTAQPYDNEILMAANRPTNHGIYSQFPRTI